MRKITFLEIEFMYKVKNLASKHYINRNENWTALLQPKK